MVRLDRHHRAYEISYSEESYEFSTVHRKEKVFDFKIANVNAIVQDLNAYDLCNYRNVN
jgi:hypothetical protein